MPLLRTRNLYEAQIGVGIRHNACCYSDASSHNIAGLPEDLAVSRRHTEKLPEMYCFMCYCRYQFVQGEQR